MDYWEQLTFLKRQIHLGLKRWPWIHQPCRQKKHVLCAQAVNWKKKKTKQNKKEEKQKSNTAFENPGRSDCLIFVFLSVVCKSLCDYSAITIHL